MTRTQPVATTAQAAKATTTIAIDGKAPPRNRFTSVNEVKLIGLRRHRQIAPEQWSRDPPPGLAAVQRFHCVLRGVGAPSRGTRLVSFQRACSGAQYVIARRQRC